MTTTDRITEDREITAYLNDMDELVNRDALAEEMERDRRRSAEAMIADQQS